MSTKYLILGADGQLGSELRSRLDQMQLNGHELRYAQADKRSCDISDEAAVRDFFARHQDTDVVFNAAAYTAVDDAEGEPDLAMKVNALGAGFVAATCRDLGARLVHFSTDFVFGEGHTVPIDEMAAPSPLSVYGSTKLAGEQLVLQNCSRAAVLRSCGLYSRWGSNFVASIAEYGRQRDTLQVVNDQYVGPTPVTTLAEVALAVADSPVFTGGVYHATVGGECTWYQFAREVMRLLEINTTVEPITARQWGAPARRPRYSVLDNRRLRLRGLDRFDSWDQELAEFLQEHGDKFSGD